MMPEDVPDELIALLRNAVHIPGPGSSAEGWARCILANTLPQHERQVREETAAEIEQLKATVARVKALAEDMRTWCSPHGIAVTYAQRIDEAIEPPAPDGIEADSEAEFAAIIVATLRKHRAEVHPEHDDACGNCAVIKGAPEILTAGLDDLPAVREFAAEHDPRGGPTCPT